MVSWRDNATDQAQADLDGLVDDAVGLAIEVIAEAGEFLPFSLAVSVDGERQAIQPNYPRERELSAAEQLVAQWSALVDVKDSLRAVAVAVNVRLPEAKRDGIEISVEHREGVAIGLIFPYTVGADGASQLDAPSAHRRDPRIWTT
jgi:hypothetical protein